MVLTGAPKNRPALLDLAHSLTKNYGLCVTCEVFEVRYNFCSVQYSYATKINMVLPNCNDLTLAFLNDHQGPRDKKVQELSASVDINMEWLKSKKRKAFYAAVADNSFREGAACLLQVSAVTRKL